MFDKDVVKIDKRKGKGKYWYYIITESCVMGDTEHEYRERRYTPKPEDNADRYEYKEYFCGNHY